MCSLGSISRYLNHSDVKTVLLIFNTISARLLNILHAKKLISLGL